MYVFGLGVHILGFKLSNFILKLGEGGNYGLKSSRKIGLLIGTHILYVFLLTLPECSLRRAILFLAFH
jgi:hypothetical protein